MSRVISSSSLTYYFVHAVAAAISAISVYQPLGFVMVYIDAITSVTFLAIIVASSMASCLIQIRRGNRSALAGSLMFTATLAVLVTAREMVCLYIYRNAPRPPNFDVIGNELYVLPTLILEMSAGYWATLLMASLLLPGRPLTLLGRKISIDRNEAR